MYKKIMRQKQFHMTNCGWNGRQWNDNDECELGQDAHTCNIIRLTFSHKVAVRAMSNRFSPNHTHSHYLTTKKTVWHTENKHEPYFHHFRYSSRFFCVIWFFFVLLVHFLHVQCSLFMPFIFDCCLNAILLMQS